MYTAIMCVAAMAVGIDAGWERIPEGGMEYIIQLDPQTLESLKAGRKIGSDIPPEAGEIRSFRIVVGEGRLSRESPPPTSRTEKPTIADQNAPPSLLSDPRGKPLAESPAVYVEPRNAAAAGPPQSKTVVETVPEAPAKPWLPLMFVLLGLFASLGANMFLGWIAWDFRHRYVAKCNAA